MRKLKNYKKHELLQGQVIIDAFKQVRNDIYLSIYCHLKPKNYNDALSNIKNENSSKNLVISIAFERPETIELLTSNTNKYFQETLLIIADNSYSPQAKNKIKQICNKAGVPYISLPKNPTKHANRSHGMAMQWSYENIIKVIKPNLFAFIDHDLIPAKPFNLKKTLKDQPFYGVLWKSEKVADIWQLWAGYCLFNYQEMTQYKLNFLYDFSNGLDTGGRNYHALYQHFNECKLRFSSNILTNFNDTSLPKQFNNNQMQIIDNCWVHMGGAGHLEGFDNRYTVFKQQMHALSQQPNWTVLSSACFSAVINTRE